MATVRACSCDPGNRPMPPPSRRSTTRGSPTGRRRSNDERAADVLGSARRRRPAAAGRGRRRGRRRVGAGRAPTGDRCAYAGVGEYAVYVSRAARGNGVGRELLEALARDAEARATTSSSARIFPENEASLALARGVRRSARSACHQKHWPARRRMARHVVVERLLGEAADGRAQDRHRLPRRRRPRRPGAADRGALELIAHRRRDPLRPPDPRRRAGRRARADAELVYVGKEGGGASVPQEEIEALMVDARARRAGPSCASRAATRSCSAAAARRREVLRARRHRVRGRARRHRRRRRAPPTPGSPSPTATRASAVALRHRPRGSRQAGRRRSTGRRWPLPGHARLLHGRARPAAHRRAR